MSLIEIGLLIQNVFDGGIEEERKLFYVAITRAKKYLCFTRAPYTIEKKGVNISC